MMGEIYAILTALLRGYSVIPVKKGLKYSTPNTSALLYLLINTCMLWILTLSNNPTNLLHAEGFVYFMLAGIIAPGVAVRFKDIRISRLGVSIASPVLGVNILFSMIIAVVFLREKITPFILIGAILTFLGVTLISIQEESHNSWKKIDLLFPLTAAALFAISTNPSEIDLETQGH